MSEVKDSHCNPREIWERGKKAKKELEGKNPFGGFETTEKIMEWYRRLTHRSGQPIYIPFGGE